MVADLATLPALNSRESRGAGICVDRPRFESVVRWEFSAELRSTGPSGNTPDGSLRSPESQPPFQAISGADQFRLLVRIVNRPIKANSNRFVRGKLKIDIRCVEADNRHWSDKTDRQATKRVTLGRHYHEEKECDKG